MDWTPDSQSIVFEADSIDDTDLQYQKSQLLVADVATGPSGNWFPNRASWGRPAVSPDGSTVAFTGYPASNHTHTVADLYVVPLSGGEPRKISGDYDRDPLNLRWAPDSAPECISMPTTTARAMSNSPWRAGGVRPVTSGAHVLTMDSVSSGLVAAGTRAIRTIRRKWCASICAVRRRW